MKQLDVYKEQLLKSNFSEAKFEPYRFFRQETDKTAFIINLTETVNGVEVVYGFCSTAVMVGCEDYFAKWGWNKDNCNLRCYLTIKSDSDEVKAKDLVQGLYILYRNTEKDELLNIVKERRKAFLHRFTELLKPLGFKKKGNKWMKQFADEYLLTFEAQKSAYSDQYYFNISIDRMESANQVGCYYTRVDTKPECIYNWQLMSDAEMEALLMAIDQQINTILNTPMKTLGKQKWVWEHCMCKRNHCDDCWVEKNLWEAKESQN